MNPNCQHYETMSTYNSLTKRLKHHRHLLSQSTRRWRNKYLTSLREQVAKGSSGNVEAFVSPSMVQQYIQQGQLDSKKIDLDQI